MNFKLSIVSLLSIFFVVNAWGATDNRLAFTLTNQDNQSFELASLRGKWVYINFIFTSCPKACPLQTTYLRTLQKEVPKKEVQFVSISIDPVNDTPEKLQEFSQHLGTDPENWSWLTGDKKDIDKVLSDFGVLRQLLTTAKGNETINHALGVYLLDPEGNLIVNYMGEVPDVTRMKKEINALIDYKG